jgi:type VI secretion system protein ImpH
MKYRYDVSYGLPGRDDLTAYLLWFIGCQPASTKRQLGVEPIRLIRYAGLLTHQPKSFSALEGMISDYWGGLPVAVEQFTGRWVAIDPADAARLGSANSSLGQDLLLGDEVYDLSGSFRISLGPADWATYTSFLPDGGAFFETWSLVRYFSPDPLSFTLEARIKAGQVPPMQLSAGDGAPRLGYTSWLRTAEVPDTAVSFETQSLWDRGAALTIDRTDESL